MRSSDLLLACFCFFDIVYWTEKSFRLNRFELRRRCVNHLLFEFWLLTSSALYRTSCANLWAANVRWPQYGGLGTIRQDCWWSCHSYYGFLFSVIWTDVSIRVFALHFFLLVRHLGLRFWVNGLRHFCKTDEKKHMNFAWLVSLCPLVFFFSCWIQITYKSPDSFQNKGRNFDIKIIFHPSLFPVIIKKAEITDIFPFMKTEKRLPSWES